MPQKSKREVPQSRRDQLAAIFNGGRYAEAEAQALLLADWYPDSGFIWKVLGAARQEQGKEAVSALQKAAVLSPDDAEAHNNLGNELTRLGRVDDAVTSLKRAVTLAPLLAEAHNNLGNALGLAKRDNDALRSYRAALEVKPNYAGAHYNLGVALTKLARLEEAETSYRQVLNINPAHADAHKNLADLLLDCGSIQEAIEHYRAALVITPNSAGIHNLLGNALQTLGLLNEARSSYARALELDPDSADAHNNLGVAQCATNIDDAIASYRRALQIRPDYPEAHNNLGNALLDCGQVVGAIVCFERAITIKPDFAEAHNNLGTALRNIGQLGEATASYRRALQIKPDFANAHSNLLYLHAFTRNISPEAECALATQWEVIALSGEERSAARDISHSFRSGMTVPLRKGRRLNIGVLSAEIGNSSVAEFLEPFLQHYDRRRFHLTLFSTTALHNPRASRLLSFADESHSVVGISDQAAADLIRDRRIDILIETTAHMFNSRLGIVARRAAPVQCHYIGYHGSTGLTEMDWFIGDEALLPPALEAHFRERIWRLPRLWIAYKADVSLPDSKWMPRPDGTIVLGSFNNLTKVREASLALWAKVMNAIPNSILFLKDRNAVSFAVQDRIRKTLNQYGIGDERVEFAGYTADWKSHMALYDRVDIALDPIPLNSGTTAFDALWMGVPLVSIEGTWMGARMTSAMLRALGKVEWVAQSEDEYVAIVAALAKNVTGRISERAVQRALMADSPLCDGVGLSRELENAFENMFDEFAQSAVPTNPIQSECDELVAIFNAGKYAEVEVQARRLASQYPDHGLVWKLWGTALLELQKTEALPTLEMAAQLSPNDPDVYNNLGNAFIEAKRTDEALATLRHALRLQPSFAQAHNNLGNALSQAGRNAEAIESYRHALRLAPDYAEAYNNLGMAQKQLVRLDEAEDSYHRALELKPEYAEAHNGLGAVLQYCGRIDDAAESYRRALEISPNFARAHNNLGNSLKNLGQLDAAATCYSRALDILPNFNEAYSNLLYLHAFTRNIPPEAELVIASEWEKIVLNDADRGVAQDVERLFRYPVTRSYRAGRKLKIGVLSAEIGQHAVTEFLTPFLEQLDRNRFHVTLFPTTVRQEPRVEQLRSLADEFRTLVGLPDRAAADLIRAAEIDILIDTTGHMTGCRLGIVEHRAAPVQCHYIGYHGSTGLTEMDWFIGDEALLPHALDAHFRERIWRLPRLWIAYKCDTFLPESQWQPRSDGSIVFGSFNNLAKVREEALALWAKVLHVVPNSTLLLKDRSSISSGVQERIRRLLSDHGIESARVVFAGHTPDWKAHMALYDSVDIALDPVPLNSGTTAFDALWMGVPLVSIEGTWMGARMTSAMLKSLGKSEWIAQSEDDYVAIVSTLAADVEGRTKQRAEQRKMMAASPLCDAVGLTRALEDAFEKMFDIRWPIGAAHDSTDTKENRKIGRG